VFKKIAGQKPWFVAMLIGALVTACVTINVYFPEAEVEEAAGEFIDKVIGSEAGGAAAQNKPTSFRFDLSPIGSAYAAADLSIETPAIKAIQQRMAERFQASLEKHFDSGALGLTRDGLIELHDAAKLALPERAAMKQLVADDNRDRAAVYREIAVANNHPEWEAEIRATFAEQWISKARKGWFYQDTKGAWVQK
jgi:uncharacterized protein YdbL (DUF1318 family)